MKLVGIVGDRVLALVLINLGSQISKGPSVAKHFREHRV